MIIVYLSYIDVKTHKKSNFNFFFEKNVHFEVGFFLVKKWAEKSFFKIFLIFRKKYDKVYISYIDIKTHKKSNFNFFFEKNVHFEVGFFLVKKWAEKIFFKSFLIFRKKYDKVYISYIDVKIHKKSNFNFFFEKNVHFEGRIFFGFFKKKYDIVYNSYTDVKTHFQILIFFSKKIFLRSDFFWLKNFFLKFF